MATETQSAGRLLEGTEGTLDPRDFWRAPPQSHAPQHQIPNGQGQERKRYANADHERNQRRI